MIALNYIEKDATILAYPLVAGTALYNFFLLMFRRHPTKNTSIVDYNIVMILIPSVLFGSTIGTIINDILPPVVSNILITILLGGFSIKFFMKLRSLIKEDEEKERERMEVEEEAQKESKDQIRIEEGVPAEIKLITFKNSSEGSGTILPESQNTFKCNSGMIGPSLFAPSSAQNPSAAKTPSKNEPSADLIKIEEEENGSKTISEAKSKTS
jgi:F0F1-type ATP synthase assembly protein I